MIAGLGAALKALAIIAAITVLAAQVGLLPNPAPPDLSGAVAGMTSLWTHAAWVNKYVPLDQAVLALGLVVVVWLPAYLIRVTVWMMTKVGILKGE